MGFFLLNQDVYRIGFYDWTNSKNILNYDRDENLIRSNAGLIMDGDIYLGGTINGNAYSTSNLTSKGYVYFTNKYIFEWDYFGPIYDQTNIYLVETTSALNFHILYANIRIFDGLMSSTITSYREATVPYLYFYNNIIRFIYKINVAGQGYTAKLFSFGYID